jgi:hypothetical protein
MDETRVSRRTPEARMARCVTDGSKLKLSARRRAVYSYCYSHYRSSHAEEQVPMNCAKLYRTIEINMIAVSDCKQYL